MEDLIHYLLEEEFPSFFIYRLTDDHLRCDVPQQGVGGDKLAGLIKYCGDNELAFNLDRGEMDVLLAILVPVGA